MSPINQRPQHQRSLFHCKPCNLLFSSCEGIMEHKAAMRLKNERHPHLHCPHCGMDFKTEAAEIKHIQQQHAEKQNLMCPGCDQGPFARMGGLMQHIERECTRIDVGMVEEMREKKLQFSNDLDRLTGSKVRANYSPFMPSNDTCGPIHPVPSDEPDPPSLTVTEFPHLTTNYTMPVPDLPEGSASLPEQHDEWEDQRPNDWDQNKTLFPDAPPAQQPTWEQLENITAKGVRQMFEDLDPHDPENHNFNPGRYYNSSSETYDCPREYCIKTFKKPGGLISHLNSPFHGEKKYHCPYCHKIFKSLSAISQHAESQGTFCHMRDTSNFNTYLDQLTAGLVNVSPERHDDGTVKYHTTEEARETFRGKGKGKGKAKVVEEPKVLEVEDGWGKPAQTFEW